MTELSWDERVEDASDEFLLDIADNIYREMIAAGLSKSQLAARMGVKPAEVSHIIGASRNFTVKKISAVAVALDLKPHDLCRERRTREKEALGLRALPGYKRVASGFTNFEYRGADEEAGVA